MRSQGYLLKIALETKLNELYHFIYNLLHSNAIQKIIFVISVITYFTSPKF